MGNPGIEYARSPHNAGFMVLDYLVTELGLNFDFSNLNYMKANLRIDDEDVLFIKPLTYMNLSGKVLKDFIPFLKDKDILLIYDDLDLPLGRIRVRKKGGSGSHNGMKSIIACLGSINFPRIRVGVGKSEITHTNKVDYLINDLDSEIENDYLLGVEYATKALKEYLSNGFNIELMMNKYNIKNITACSLKEEGAVNQKEEINEQNL